MKITCEHFPGKYPQFNVSLSSAEGKEPFLTIKGCRIIDSKNGEFVSWPSRKLDDGKYWNHCYASDGFATAVLNEAKRTMPQPETRAPVRQPPLDDDIPF